jgi:hypothetical protein
MTQTTNTTETYAQRRAREVAEADALRARGSKLARKLLALQTQRMDAQGPKAQAVAIARLEGAAEALAALHGYTPHAYEMAVIGPWQKACTAGPRPVMNYAPGGNLPLLRWEADLAEAIDAELAKLI